MGVWNSLSGTLRIEFVSADTAATMRRLNECGVRLSNTAAVSDLTIQADISRQDWKKVKAVLEKRGETVRLIRKNGLYWSGKRALHRPVLLAFMSIYLLLSLYLPTRIFFVRVDGNGQIPDRMILEMADSCGIRFGASRRKVRSEQVKNELIGMLPQLQWVGVNTSGCVAVISVKERSSTDNTVKEELGISSIVAGQDAIIRQITVTNGTALCQPGQAVKAGQTLISGYTDCGISIRATRAKGEIQGQTLRRLEAVSLTNGTQRGEIIRTEEKFSLLIGKKLINFFKDSGILGTTCVKMYKENYMTLPGGFRLPIAIVTQSSVYYDTDPAVNAADGDWSWLAKDCEQYLLSHMVAGQILDQSCDISFGDGICTAAGKYACLELIGRMKNEEIINYNG